MSVTPIFASTQENAQPPARSFELDDIEVSQMRVMKRDGEVAEFHPEKIEMAMLMAHLEVMGSDMGNSISSRNKIKEMRNNVIRVLWQRKISGGTMAIHIEEIQDVVEGELMRRSDQKVARAYVLYRDNRNRMRAETEVTAKARSEMYVTNDAGERILFPRKEITEMVISACNGLRDVEPSRVIEAALPNLYDGASLKDLRKAMVMAARAMIEQEPNYTKVCSRLLLNDIRLEILGRPVKQKEMQKLYPGYFVEYIDKGIKAGLLNPAMGEFDLKVLGKVLNAQRDLQFTYMGLQTLYDRYFLHVDDARIEMPQAMFMRVAMGLALNEPQKEARAIEFYHLLSSFDFMCSTPTLFNAGSLRSQLSSCYLTTVGDDLGDIYDAIKENALLSKYAGGLGNDWTPVRSLGAHIKGTNGRSQGVVPFLKVVNDTAVAVNQGGKRKGAVCAYLETWHLDIEAFLELRKNTGDERRRTHDMNSANWIPDLFMKRVMEDKEWTLFSPSSVPDLHDLTGVAFEKSYVAAEAAAARGEIKPFKKIEAKVLWRKMLSMLFETGHPWITFKDPCNIRSPQQHMGVVHSSNLCTEITLNTSNEEIAVCNLGSINLPQHMKNGALDHVKLQKTARIAMRMLDNVIDINFYPVKKAETSNKRHRPVGMGVMGFQDCLYMMRTPFATQAAIEFSDRSMEAVCYYAYLASTELAEERGAYSSFKGSLWDKGILPHDSVALLTKERGGYLEVDNSVSMDWTPVRERIAKFGMRNSNCVAIAPTATISNIINVNACIEPAYKNLFVKSNLSGEFTEINEYLVNDLKAIGLWDKVMIADLKHFDGSLANIQRIPQELRDIYSTAFDFEPSWLIECAARRQKWIDQAQSLNIYMSGVSGKKLDETYKLAWLRGLKTTYYLRSMGATSTEKSTGAVGEHNAVKSGGPAVAEVVEGAACFMRPGDPGFDECESCQ